jgi:hypothetical protein
LIRLINIWSAAEPNVVRGVRPRLMIALKCF